MKETEPQNILLVSHSVALVNFFKLISSDECFLNENWDPEADVKVLKNSAYMALEIIPNKKGSGKHFCMQFVEKHICMHLPSAEVTGISKFATKSAQTSKYQSCVHQ